MKARYSVNEGIKYVEIDLTILEMENIKRGRYPIRNLLINGISYVISVGLEE